MSGTILPQLSTSQPEPQTAAHRPQPAAVTLPRLSDQRRQERGGGIGGGGLATARTAAGKKDSLARHQENNVNSVVVSDDVEMPLSPNGWQNKNVY